MREMTRSHILRTTRKSGLKLLMLLCCVYTFDRMAVVESRQSDTRPGCYDDEGNAQQCQTTFVNAAFGRPVDVTNTCGVEGPQEYCLLAGDFGSKKTCSICNSHRPNLAHPPHYMTDIDYSDSRTWWQSETMYEGIAYPNQVNITLNLGKAFDITYIRISFHSPRPDSFAIFKQTSDEDDWTPYQYYSTGCQDIYGVPHQSPYLTNVPREDQKRALCTSEFSDIIPFTGGNVAFSTLAYRPSAFDFENSQELQEWVTATKIRIVLDRLNTFGDEVSGDIQVLRSYFYAISDLSIGARCKCNGHASECVETMGVDGQSQLACRCEHNTTGRNCEECLPFYNDAPWARATFDEANECRPCNCNGYSNRCYFDQEQYDRTGHGGYCLDCADNRAGPNCERCKDTYYERADGACIACTCDEMGVLAQCSDHVTWWCSLFRWYKEFFSSLMS